MIWRNSITFLAQHNKNLELCLYFRKLNSLVLHIHSFHNWQFFMKIEKWSTRSFALHSDILMRHSIFSKHALAPHLLSLNKLVDDISNIQIAKIFWVVLKSDTLIYSIYFYYFTTHYRCYKMLLKCSNFKFCVYHYITALKDTHLPSK